MSRQWEEVQGPAGTLAVHVARSGSATPRATLILCHGFPLERDAASRTGRTFPALADRLAAESGWEVVTGCLRGVGLSAGNFSLDGWLADLRALVVMAARSRRAGVWVAGFGTSGGLALCLAAQERRVRGVACLGSSATFADWGQDLSGMAEFARQVGVIREAAFPADLHSWGRPFSDLRPLEAAAALSPRPVLIVHGTEDEGVPVADARALAEACGPSAELRLLAGAGHRLRADPRAVALLLGWLERQGP